ncbi:MAG: FkbM family methyltransferase [Rhodospirillales bacterium]|jgi:FkbM family methyltransferase|nr:FkbM family methyltransferase [Rhodospirillales bacterium]
MSSTVRIDQPLITAASPQSFMIRTIRAVPAYRWPAFRVYNKLLKLANRHRQTKTFYGALIECDIADLIMMCIYHFGVWEPHISALIQARLRPGDVFCDVGANIGYHTLLAARAVGDEGNVVAIEPSPRIFDRLARNVRLNDAPNVRLVKAAVAETPGVISLYQGFAHNLGLATTVQELGGEKECDVTALPLAAILTEHEQKRLRLIKIDVEGGERPILRNLAGAMHLFPDDVEILVEVSAADPDQLADDAALFRTFYDLGFKSYAVRNSYDIESEYINFSGIAAPVRVDLPLRKQQDVLFSRSADIA